MRKAGGANVHFQRQGRSSFDGNGLTRHRKTLTAIAAAGALYNAVASGVFDCALLSILGVWQDEFNNFADFDYNLAVLTGTSARK